MRMHPSPLSPEVNDYCAVRETDGENGSRRRGRRGTGRETRRRGFIWSAVFLSSLVRTQCSSTQYQCLFFFSISLRPCSTVRPTKATCCMKEIKSCNESETKAIFKETGQFFSFSFNSFSSCAKLLLFQQRYRPPWAAGPKHVASYLHLPDWVASLSTVFFPKASNK